jgi:5-aminolevulinate synthase
LSKLKTPAAAPLLVDRREKCKMACDLLLPECGNCIEPINYPVSRCLERLRITPSPYHDDALIDHLAAE